MSDIINTALSETEPQSGGGERRRRTGGRGGDRSRTGVAGKYRNLVNRLTKTELLDPSALDDMHEASLTILEEIGMDIMLPEVSGYDICRDIRTDPGLADVRVLMMTARGSAAEQKRVLALGADGQPGGCQLRSAQRDTPAALDRIEQEAGDGGGHAQEGTGERGMVLWPQEPPRLSAFCGCSARQPCSQDEGQSD